MRPVTIHILIRSLRELILRTLQSVLCIFTGPESWRTIVLTSWTLNTSRSPWKSTLVDPRETTICAVTAPMKPCVRITRVSLRVPTSQWPGSWPATWPCAPIYSKKRALAALISKYTNLTTRCHLRKSWSLSRYQTDIPLNSFLRRICVRANMSSGWLYARETAVYFSLWNHFTLSTHLANLW